MAFIKFTEHGRSYTPKVSISRSGMLSLNDGARKRFGLDDRQVCVLYYDPDTKRIGIEFTTDASVDGARKVRLRETGADIAAKSFLQYFDICVEQTMLYTLETENDGELVTIQLGTGRPRLSKSDSRNPAIDKPSEY